MSKLFPALLSLALLLVLMSACNRDAVDSSQGDNGTFLAPASAPLNPNARSAEDEGKLKMAPAVEDNAIIPGEDEGGAYRLTDEEVAAAKRAGPGRMTTASRATAPKTTAASAAPKTMEAPVAGRKPALDNYDRTVATISKTGCYGECRQFALTLTNDRRLLLDAGKNMDRKGKYSRVLNTSEYNELLVAIQAAKLAELGEVYPLETKNIPADSPATVLRFPDLNGDERKVEVYNEAPEKLEAFLTTFEAWVDKDGWIKTAE